MTRPEQPQPMGFFDRRRPPAGPHVVTLRLGPLEIEISGLDDRLAEMLIRRYTVYATRSPGGSGALQVRLTREPVECFIDSPERDEVVRVLLACDGERIRYMSYRVAGWFDTVGGHGDLLLARTESEPAQRALENYIRAAVAWQAACRGGVLVHAASAVWQNKAYLFYGESGAGKSTLSASNRRARVVSDDLSLILPGDHGGLDLVGSPFRGTYEEGDPVVGRFPLTAGFRLIQAAMAQVTAVPRIRAMAELVGNLPFVAEAFGDRPDILSQVERTFADVPLAHLQFAKDDTYWDAIAAAGYA